MPRRRLRHLVKSYSLAPPPGSAFTQHRASTAGTRRATTKPPSAAPRQDRRRRLSELTVPRAPAARQRPALQGSATARGNRGGSRAARPRRLPALLRGLAQLDRAEADRPRRRAVGAARGRAQRHAGYADVWADPAHLLLEHRRRRVPQPATADELDAAAVASRAPPQRSSRSPEGREVDGGRGAGVARRIASCLDRMTTAKRTRSRGHGAADDDAAAAGRRGANAAGPPPPLPSHRRGQCAPPQRRRRRAPAATVVRRSSGDESNIVAVRRGSAARRFPLWRRCRRRRGGDDGRSGGGDGDSR